MRCRAHVVRTFESPDWVSAGLSYGQGGESKVNGERKDDSKSNLLYGLSFGFPIGGAQSVRVGYIRGDAFEDTGMDSHSVILTWALRF